MNHFENAVNSRQQEYSHAKATEEARKRAEHQEAERLGQELVGYLENRNIPARPILQQKAEMSHSPSWINKVVGNAQHHGWKYSVEYSRIGEGWIIFDGPDYIEMEGHRDVYAITTEGGVFKPAHSEAHPKVYGASSTIRYRDGYDRILTGDATTLEGNAALRVLNSPQVLDYIATIDS